MIINASNVNNVNKTIASQVNSQYANKLAQSDLVNKSLTELQVRNMSTYSSLFAPPENQVMSGLTAMADVYRAFEHSFSSVLDPITKQAEKQKQKILDDVSLSQSQKDEQITALTKTYAADVKKAASDLTDVYNGMLGGMKQIYSAGGMLGEVVKQFGDMELSDLTLTLEDLELQNVDQEIQMDDIKASIQRARDIAKGQQQALVDVGKAFGHKVLTGNYQSGSKPSIEAMLQEQSNMFSQSLNSLLYSNVASPYKTLNNTITTMFNLSSQFSKYNILI